MDTPEDWAEARSEDADGDSSTSDPFQVDGPANLDRALQLVRFLRANCPWDEAQTPRSLIPHLLEEAHEVADAIRSDDSRRLEGELGDLLLNVAFQIVIGEERGDFDRTSVGRRLEDKMKRRHPHLFGLGEKEDWETLKARERSDGEGVLEGLASGVGPLLQAHRIQEKVSGVGFDWSEVRGALDKVSEELEEVAEALKAGQEHELGEELGDLLFSVVNVTRLVGAHADDLLDRANRKFRTRFEQLETLARDTGVVLGEATLEELDELWDRVKESERKESRAEGG